MTIAACEKEDDFKTSGELIGETIIDITQSQNITQAKVFLWDINSSGRGYYYTIHEGVSFSIDGPFLIVEDYYYNLNSLTFWKLQINDRLIQFYFK